MRSRKHMGDTKRERLGKAYRTFKPLRELSKQIKDDAVDSIKGVPILFAWGEHMAAADALHEIAMLFGRMDKEMDVEPINTLAKRLKHSVPLDMDTVKRFDQAIDNCEALYLTLPVKQIKEAILTEQIAIEMSAMGVV